MISVMLDPTCEKGSCGQHKHTNTTDLKPCPRTVTPTDLRKSVTYDREVNGQLQVCSCMSSMLADIKWHPPSRFLFVKQMADLSVCEREEMERVSRLSESSGGQGSRASESRTVMRD